jgi:hypothetical protein
MWPVPSSRRPRGGGDLEADDSVGGCSESAKRRLPDSVLPLPAPPLPQKRGRGAEAGGLRGEAERGATGARGMRGQSRRGPGGSGGGGFFAGRQRGGSWRPESGVGGGLDAEDETARGSWRRGVTEKFSSGFLFFYLPAAGASPSGRTFFFIQQLWRKLEFLTTK